MKFSLADAFDEVEHAILTNFVNPPIPVRNFDWQATQDGYDEGDPVGYGSTESEAVADLQGQL